MKYPQQSCPPPYRATRRVDPLLPVILHVAIALPPPCRRGIENKLPETPQQERARPRPAFSCSMLPPPPPNRAPELCKKTLLRRHACMLPNGPKGPSVPSQHPDPPSYKSYCLLSFRGSAYCHPERSEGPLQSSDSAPKAHDQSFSRCSPSSCARCPTLVWASEDAVYWLVPPPPPPVVFWNQGVSGIFPTRSLNRKDLY